VVDIDENELNKPTIKPTIAICSDAKDFICKLNEAAICKDWGKWINWCLERKRKYPVVLSEYKHGKQGVQPYYFIDKLTQILSDKAIVVAGNGSASVTLFQASVVKFGQQYIWNSGCAAMGYDLPAAIGASVGNPEKTIICVAGDGSLMMNLQELATMAQNKLPIKLIILNNQGYISIKQTQDSFFNGNYIGSGLSSGISFPDFQKTAQVFGLETMSIDSHDEMDVQIKKLLAVDNPIVCEVKLNTNYQFIPKTSSEKKPDGRIISKPLEDLYPFLPRKEFLENMIIKPLEE
jgi:acetolactate synthase-1/2/3 large subunit